MISHYWGRTHSHDRDSALEFLGRAPFLRHVSAESLAQVVDSPRYQTYTMHNIGAGREKFFHPKKVLGEAVEIFGASCVVCLEEALTRSRDSMPPHSLSAYRALYEFMSPHWPERFHGSFDEERGLRYHYVLCEDCSRSFESLASRTRSRVGFDDLFDYWLARQLQGSNRKRWLKSEGEQDD